MPKPLEWTSELISKFWDGISEIPEMNNLSFGKNQAYLVELLINTLIGDDLTILDYGGGDGSLAKKLVESGHTVSCFEDSPVRAAEIEALLSGMTGYLGNVTSMDSATFPVIVCTEVIEHIPNSHTQSFIAGLSRFLDPNEGFLFLTTPYDENLEDQTVYCPTCDHAFHKWQHLQSWTLESLEGVMLQSGFNTYWLGRCEFDKPDSVYEFVLRTRLGESWPSCEQYQERSVPVIGGGQHIVYIGKKAGGVSEK